MLERTCPKKLLVEGRTEQRVIPELMEANGVTWPDNKEEAPVYIKEFDGIHNMLETGVIPTEIKASSIEVVGIMVDANDDAESRFQNIRDRCIDQFPDMPDTIGEDGLIHSSEGKSIGVWLMPDNRSTGMLETFLTYLAPDEQDGLLCYAEEVCREAKEDKGAPYKPAHYDKAKIYTWLAWQDEPGRQLHQAVKERILSPNSAYGAGFVNWFRELFQV